MPDAENAIVIPGWLAKFIGSLFAAFVIATGSWAYQLQQGWWVIQQDISTIKAEIRSANEIRSVELQSLTRRVDRNEIAIEKLIERLKGQ